MKYVQCDPIEAVQFTGQANDPLPLGVVPCGAVFVFVDHDGGKTDICTGDYVEYTKDGGRYVRRRGWFESRYKPLRVSLDTTLDGFQSVVHEVCPRPVADEGE